MEGVRTVARLMEISARTAPKAKGQDYILTKVLSKEEIQKLGEEMVKYGEEKNHPGYVRDGKNVKDSQSVLLIGLKDHPPLRTNCGACGFDCSSIRIGKEEKEFVGPNCVKRVVDLGIALGSAVKTASMLNVDNRIMYHAGHIARKIGLMNANLVYAVPLSVSGKNIYFDRG